MTRTQLYLAPALIVAGAVSLVLAIASLDPEWTGALTALGLVLLGGGLVAADRSDASRRRR